MKVTRLFAFSAASVVLFVLVSSQTLASEILSDGDFDALSVGSAPSNGQPAGAWQFATDAVEESGSRQIQIVETASFIPDAPGNSLSVSRPQVPHAPVALENHFNRIIREKEREIVRATFDLYIPETETPGRPRVNVFLGGNHGGEFPLSKQEDRGPQLNWLDNGTLYTWSCDRTDDCDSYIRTPVVENTPLNTWQNVQIDIDLNSDTYDLFWGTAETEMQLVAPYSRFRSDEQDFLDRFVVAFFLNPEFSYPAGNAYLDNISVEVIQRDWIGDANMDGEFNSGDFVAVFQAGKYETSEIAAWSQGDWNGDRVFDSGDFVAAFQDGGYEMGPRSIANAVPEPSGCLFATLAALLFPLIRRERP